MNKRNGFTLAELLGVIVILAVIVLIAFPPIVNQIKNTQGKLSQATLDLIYSATEIYAHNNQNTYPIYNGNNYCISLQTLVNSGDLKYPVKDAKTGQNISLDKIVKMNITNAANIDYSIVDTEQCVVIDNRPIVNADKTGVNAPMLSDNMIPIKWNGIEWVKADKRNPAGENRWYNYAEQEWANVVLVTSATRSNYMNMAIGEPINEADVLAYFVWIPRYKYRLFNVEALSVSIQKIDVIFESKSTPKSNGTENGQFLTHPAFTFGTKELSGFWAGKFETTGNATTPTIKPNVVALTNQNIKTQFDTAQKFNNALTYGLSATNDAHMMKSMEWGAVAYLSQSTYGKYDNPLYTDESGLEKEIYINNINTDTGSGNGSTVTGCAGDSVNAAMLRSTTCPALNQYDTTQGVKASTTGNVYGIYDMSGGTWDRTMGAMYNIDNTTIMISSSGFAQAVIDSSDMDKYINKYTYGTTMTDQAAYNRRQLGDSTGEVRGWNSDGADFVYSGGPWLYNGGAHSYGMSAGIFYFDNGSGAAGGNYSFRVTLLGE
jgi:prepilin-type N-terminal cleavage/methylation domain-containing protein